MFRGIAAFANSLNLHDDSERFMQATRQHQQYRSLFISEWEQTTEGDCNACGKQANTGRPGACG